MNQLDVCLSPKLFNQYSIKGKIVVIVDILRATSIITTMFKNGVKKVIPVKSLNEAREYKEKGYLVAAEREGNKINFADFDNSPFTFTKEKIEDKTLVYSTTNGTNTINIAKDSEKLVLASFLNLSAISDYLENMNKDIIILCSGWKGNYCLEDHLFTGALIEKLIQNGTYEIESDSALSALDLWEIAQNDLLNYIKKIFQYKRLTKLGMQKIIEYCFTSDITNVIPTLENNYIVDLKYNMSS